MESKPGFGLVRSHRRRERLTWIVATPLAVGEKAVGNETQQVKGDGGVLITNLREIAFGDP